MHTHVHTALSSLTIIRLTCRNYYRKDNMTETIYKIRLTKGYVATIWEGDRDLILCSWTPVKDSSTVYAKRTVNYKAQWLHRVILERKLGRKLLSTERVDHIDNNGLNCCRDNLRLATHAQNMGNQRKSKNNTTGYKGVTKYRDKYRARIGFQGKDISLGSYPTAELAAVAYDQAAKRYFGEFAKTNFQ